MGLSKIGKLNEPRKILATFSDSQVRQLVSFKPRTTAERRTHTTACLLLDTGLRIDEALSLRREDVDLDGLVLRINSGKGGKGRVVPFSLPARKLLFRYLSEQQPQYGSLVFFAGDGSKINQRNALRSFKRLCSTLDIHGVRCSFHTLRHTFATHYLRAGGGSSASNASWVTARSR